MQQEMKTTIGILVGAVLVFGAVIFFWSKTDTSKVDMTRLVRTDSYSVGPVDAKVQIVEFADYQCPACAAAEPILNQYLAEYKDKVRYTYRYFPIPGHEHAVLAMNFAEAAGEQGKFFEMGNMLFEKQSDWGEKTGDQTALFMSYAKTLGLDTARIKAFVDANKANEKIQRDQADALAIGVNSTPTFFFNGEKEVGVLSLATMRELTDKILKEAK